MTKELQTAEDELVRILSGRPDGAKMDDVLKALAETEIDEAELRAAVWILRARGSLKFQAGRLQLAAA